MAIYNKDGEELLNAYNEIGIQITEAFDVDANIVFSKSFPVLPVPSGDLTASEVIPLPDLYEQGKGFTCTGLTFDGLHYYCGDIGALSGTNYNSQIVVTDNFSDVINTIPLTNAFSEFRIVQGVAFDRSDGTLWCCDPDNGKIYHITTNGDAIGSISATTPTGIAYDGRDDTFWVLNYSNKIIHMSKNGSVLGSYNFSYSETLDQCFLDEGRGYLYITAGVNYSSRNNVYLFNTATAEQSVACTVDSYSVEGIWIGADRMIILNDGYYHSAVVMVNQANIYDLS